MESLRSRFELAAQEIESLTRSIEEVRHLESALEKVLVPSLHRLSSCLFISRPFHALLGFYGRILLDAHNFVITDKGVIELLRILCEYEGQNAHVTGGKGLPPAGVRPAVQHRAWRRFLNCSEPHGADCALRGTDVAAIASRPSFGGEGRSPRPADGAERSAGRENEPAAAGWRSQDGHDS